MAASTTQKLTIATVALIQRFCTTFNAGVIVRFKGEELGLTAGGHFGAIYLADEGYGSIKQNTMTIPKATVAQMTADLAKMDALAHPKFARLFSDLTTSEQNDIRKMFKTEVLS